MTQPSSTNLDTSHQGVSPALPNHHSQRESKQRIVVPPTAQRSQSLQTERAGSQIDPAVVQLISRTAHDLRAPLTTIRESVRLVRDGEFGTLSSTQSEYLSAAIDQCNCVNQMVDEMVHMQSLGSSFPRARRQWVSIRDVRAAVSDTLKPWVLPRGTHVLWDGTISPSAKVFADLTMLRRLIVNLVVNAIRGSVEGDPVLVRLTDAHSGRAIRWSVVDQGRGISAADMGAIASGRVPENSGSGLGLMISRQLAAVHYSSLWIESRVNTGTVASFETPSGGPTSVVAAWMRWRENNQAPSDGNGHVVKSFVRKRDGGDAIMPPRRVRFDVPTLLVKLSAEKQPSTADQQIVVGIVSLGAATSLEAALQFDSVLQRDMSAREFAYRVGNHRWVCVLESDVDDAIQRLADIERQAHGAISGLRISQRDLIEMGQVSDAMATRLSDLLVRKTLQAAKRHFIDANEVRLGTTPVGTSSVATRRLDFEVHRIRNRNQ